MKKRLQGLIAGVLIGATITGGVVFATIGTQTIEVLYNNIKVYKDNVLCELKDANGTVVEPFIYNGTTYMPARGTANLAGMDVTWDGRTQSVYLWDEITADDTYLMDVCPPYAGNVYTDDFKLAGKLYSGFSLYRGDYSLFNLNGKYTSLNMMVGPVDGYCDIDDEATIKIILDNKTVKIFDMKVTDYPTLISVPLNNALQMRIEYQSDYNTTRIGFGNITVQ